ncbi:MAG: hypothetical protein MUC95_06355 [Spirochaetes bacterium]|nr:hypothetical protein [Spirochaetota bacterium]
MIVNIIDSQEKGGPSKDLKKVSDNVVKQISTENVFWNTIIEIIMEFKDTKGFQWISKHPQLAVSIIVIWGLIIMGIFFAFMAYIILK